MITHSEEKTKAEAGGFIAGRLEPVICDMQTEPKPCTGSGQQLTGVALGFFDGVHLGHRELLHNLVYRSTALGLKPLVFTMDRYPKPTHRPDGSALFDGLIQTTEMKMETMAQLGVAQVIVQTFNEAFKNLSPEAFLNEILYDKLGARLIVAGRDYRFGRGAAGDVEQIKEWAEQKGVEFLLVDPVEQDGEIISSTNIRRAIKAGEMMKASRLLGSAYKIRGEVVKGNSLGRTVGLPTANIRVPDNALLPPFGVYATRTKVGPVTYPSLTNIGTRPTVNHDETDILLETVILDEEINLYGQTIEVSFLNFERPEQKFNSFLLLTAQMHEDAKNVRHWHDSHEQLWQVGDYCGIETWCLPAKRFHSNAIQINFSNPRDERLSPLHILLARVLMSSSAAYPDRKILSRHLDSLYGATLRPKIRYENDWLRIVFAGEAINRTLGGADPFKGLVKTLCEALLNPLLDEDGHLDAATVEREKRMMLAEAELRGSNPSFYAMHRLAEDSALKLAGETASGDLEQIKAVTAQELTQVWREWLLTSQIKVYVAGTADGALLKYLLNIWQDLPGDGSRRVRQLPGVAPAPFIPTAPVKEEEIGTVSTAVLVVAYSGLYPYTSYRIAAMDVLACMLGGAEHALINSDLPDTDLLLSDVRLTIHRFYSALTIQANVADSKTEKAANFIQAKIDDLAAGRYRPDLFGSAVKLVSSRIHRIGDNLSDLLSFRCSHAAGGRDLDVLDSLNLVHQVKEDEVRALAGALQLCASFALLPADEDSDQATGQGRAVASDRTAVAEVGHHVSTTEAETVTRAEERK